MSEKKKVLCLHPPHYIKGTLSNDEDGDNNNVKKQLVL